MVWQCDEIFTFVPSSRRIITFLELPKKIIRNLAASHQTWNVTKCDENATSHHFVTVPHSNPGPGSGKIPAWNDPKSCVKRRCRQFLKLLVEFNLIVPCKSGKKSAAGAIVFSIHLWLRLLSWLRNQVDIGPTASIIRIIHFDRSLKYLFFEDMGTGLNLSHETKFQRFLSGKRVFCTQNFKSENLCTLNGERRSSWKAVWVA